MTHIILRLFLSMHLHILNVSSLVCRYFRSGAPPVINPLNTRFPKDTIVPGSFAVTLTWTLPNRTTGVFNVTSPLPGDWFLAAHLPKDEGKISVKVRADCELIIKHFMQMLLILVEAFGS